MTSPASRTRSRPLIAVPSRFASSTSALRYSADVTARALAHGVYAAGGEPLMVHPVGDPDRGVDALAADVADRMAWADGILLPGGGDLSPRFTGDELHPSHYDVDQEQDIFDLALGRVAWDGDRPLLAICRGLQVINVLLGGTLTVDMAEVGITEHRHVTHDIEVRPGSLLHSITGAHTPRVHVSCYHHQAMRDLGPGLTVTARAEDGTIEAVEAPGRAGWFLGVQWHPEDTCASNPAQAAIFRAFVDACR